MEKEFLPYAEALALKELGFDEPCFSFYYLYKDENHQEGKFDYRGELNIEYSIYKENTYYILAPTFSQAFRWFRENYGLEGISQRAEDKVWYKFSIYLYLEDGKRLRYGGYEYLTSEEAELECLEKLIEIVKEKYL
jgi:hypothetical protein